MNLIDSHSHLFLEEFVDDLPLVMDRARQAGVSHIFMPNIDNSTIKPMLDVCATYAGYCSPMLGLHPTSVNAGYLDELEAMATHLKPGHPFVAIGEIGMDLYWDKTFLKEQLVAFDVQLQWALHYDLPVVIHCREAFDHIYKVLQGYKGTTLRGIFHSFTGTAEDAARILEFPDFLIGINGVVTFKKSSLPEALTRVPLERLVLETDSPYLAPVPKRGTRNESSYLPYTLQKVADIYGQPAEKVARITTENALKMFGRLQ